MGSRTEDFLKSLYDEKLKHKEHRMALVLQKLIFVISLFSLGSLKFQNLDLHILLFLIPFIALSYDVFIFAEDYKVKRIGIFIRVECSNSACAEELHWEKWVNNYREPLAAFSSLILTTITVVASYLLLYLDNSYQYPLMIWLPLCIVSTCCVFFYAALIRLELKYALKTNDQSINKSSLSE